MIQLIKKLNEPFPDRNSGNQNARTFVVVGVFVALFLFILKPFGLSAPTFTRALICLGFGLVTFLFGWSYEFGSYTIFKLRTDSPSWTLGKWMVHSIGLLCWIATGNIVFSGLVFGWGWMDLSFVLQMLLNTFIVGIFPLVVAGLTIQIRALKKNVKEADQLNLIDSEKEHSSIVISIDPNHKIELESVRYLEAMQNYVAIYLYRNNEMEKLIVRSSLSNIVELFQGTSVIRCHRSFAVNHNTIKNVEGNAQGLKLTLNNVVSTKIPVSRRFIDVLKEVHNP